METVKPNEKRARNAVTLIILVLALDVLSLISSYLQYDLLQTLIDGGEVSNEAAVANDLREQVIGYAYMLAYAASAWTFILWFRRAYYNLHQKVNYLSYAEGWAAGSWFVPVLSFFRPYQIMRELYRETRDILTINGIATKENFTPQLLGWWWMLWLLNQAVGQIVIRYTLQAEGLEELGYSTLGSMLSSGVGIPLALVTLGVIRRYAGVEALMHELPKREDPAARNKLQWI